MNHLIILNFYHYDLNLLKDTDQDQMKLNILKQYLMIKQIIYLLLFDY